MTASDDWQVVATRTVRRFPWSRSEQEAVILYDGVTRAQAEELAAMLNRQESGVTYEAREKASDA